MSPLPLTCRLLVALLLVLAAVCPAIAQEGAPSRPADEGKGAKSAVKRPKRLDPPPTADQIRTWIRELDSDEFVVRETATENLIASGQPALAPLRKALSAGGSLESTTRALHALQQLALISDFDTQEEARTLLEEIAAKSDTSTGRRAATVLASLNERRSAYALAELEELGANISRTQAVDGFGGVQEIVDSIEIGTSWKGEDRDLRRLKWLQPINRLVLVGDKVGDEALSHVTKMQQLTSLHAYHANITDKGVAELAGMEKLQELGIYYIPISDAGIKPLKENKSLISLRLYGTNATREEADRLKEALGLGKIDFRDGAFLGVGCETVNEKCIISNVHPDSPADKAGIRDQDVLVQFDGKPITDFTDLTTRISKYKAGDTVEVELLRTVYDENNDSAEKRMTLKVTLGEWDVSIFIRGRLAP